MTNGQISTKEHLEKVFDEFKGRYLSDQQSRDKAFDDFKKQLGNEGKLLADSYLKDLKAYPTVADFNELKDKVTNEFGTAVGKAKAFAVGLGLIAVGISGAGLLYAVMK